MNITVHPLLFCFYIYFFKLATFSAALRKNNIETCSSIVRLPSIPKALNYYWALELKDYRCCIGVLQFFFNRFFVEMYLYIFSSQIFCTLKL